MNTSGQGRQPYAPAHVLGLGGLIPFVALPLLALVLDEAHQESLLHALVLYDQATGMTELHFGIFVLLAFLLCYRDWKVILVADTSATLS